MQGAAYVATCCMRLEGAEGAEGVGGAGEVEELKSSPKGMAKSLGLLFISHGTMSWKFLTSSN